MSGSARPVSGLDIVDEVTDPIERERAHCRRIEPVAFDDVGRLNCGLPIEHVDVEVESYTPRLT